MAFNQEIADKVCELLTRKSLRRICAEDESLPDRRTIERWMTDNVEFAAKCARAREIHADHEVDGVEDIEEGVLSGEIKPDAARVVISSVQWRASKLHSRRYGEKVAIGGADDLPPIKSTRPLADMSLEEIRAALNSFSK